MPYYILTAFPIPYGHAIDRAFPCLNNFIGAYLNQDCGYFGDAIEAILAAYYDALDISYAKA